MGYQRRVHGDSSKNLSTDTSATMVEAAKKAKKTKAPAAHPKYSVMIPAAIAGLKDRSGSSRQAILKWIKANYRGVDHPQAGQHLNMALKAGVKKGTLKMARASGKGAGSFKLGEKPKAAKKAKKPKAAKKKPAKKAPKAKKPAKKAAKKVKKPAKKAAAKKKPVKKAAKKPAKKAAPKKK